jgi:iron complex transport system substrate-binding protein
MKRRLLGILVAFVVLLVACGDGSDKTAVTGAASTTAAVAEPRRIVSLSPTATEMLFAIGAGPQVVAVDDQSDYPPEAPRSDLSGYRPNIEAIAAKKPDLVVAAYDTDQLVTKLQVLGITTLVLPPARTVADSYAQMEQLGTATGNVAGATDAVLRMRTRIESTLAKAPKPSKPLRYFHEVDNTLYTATSKTFIGEMYTLAGLVNVADTADKDGSGYPQLSTEYLLAQNPDIVFLADTKCCAQSAKTFAARPGFDRLTAVRTGAVIQLDDDIASRWGPRTADLLDTVVQAVAKLSSTSGH